VALLVALVAYPVGASADEGGGAFACPLPKPQLNGPARVHPGDKYSISWTDVLGAEAKDDAYLVERSLDPAFATGVERHTTDESSYAFPVVILEIPEAGVLYHRVTVRSPCPSPNPATVVSDTFSVPIQVDCPAPGELGEIHVSPEKPPGGSTYVVSWNTLGSGVPGPGGGAVGLSFRLRRTAPDGSKDWVTDRGSASFTDAPGAYEYEVRAEASCGAVGPWSEAKSVVVVDPTPQLVLVSEPKPIVVTALTASSAGTLFAVRNAGAGTVSVKVSAAFPVLTVSPDTFTIQPNGIQQIAVGLNVTTPTPLGRTSVVSLDTGGFVLKVPINFLVATSPAISPVGWSVAEVEVNERGDPVPVKIVNPSAAPAAFTAVIRQPWVSFQSLDGRDWDRQMAAGEERSVLVVVDRSLRRSSTGSETSLISLVTAGVPGTPSSLVVVDDGAPPSISVSPGTPGGPSGGGPTGPPPKTRILFPSLPNAADAKGIGWFSSDLWVTNTDAVNVADVGLILTPVARRVVAGPGVAEPPSAPTLHRFDVQLAPGETRRFRNLLKAADLEGAASLEVRSSATTITATAIVSNQPIAPPAAALAVTAPAGAAAAAALPLPRVFGSEMRPVAPGEGAKASDPRFVVSGLAYDANRRTNLLLAETSGLDTDIEVKLLQSNGTPATKGGQPVVIRQRILAGQTLQINYPDLFDETATYASAYFYALVAFQPGTGSGGSVVPLATVLDNRTQNFSLHVGTSTSSLDPTKPPSAQVGTATRDALAPGSTSYVLPYGGGAAPLFFPAAHSIGAPLSDGKQPIWRTRVTLTNTGSLPRQVRLTFLDKMGGGTEVSTFVGLTAGFVFSFEDLLSPSLGIPEDGRAYGGVRIENVQDLSNWQDVDVQTEVYTADPNPPDPSLPGEFRTGMEAYPYWHGYSSFQSNLGTVQMEGAETSSRYRTNLILQEVGGAPCEVAVAVYVAGSFVPLAQGTIALNQYDYFSRELFKSVLGLDLGELTDVRVVVRQISGDGVFMAFASKINLATGAPANIFLRPAMAGTGR
jgi:hypothetical protein